MDEFTNSNGWTEVLKEKPQNVIRIFIDENLVRKCDLSEKMEAKFKVTELKPLLKKRNLPVSGKKSILIERLLQSDRAGMEVLVKDCDALVCTEKGRTIANDFIKKEEEIRHDVEQKVLLLLAQGKFRDARISVAHYRAEQVFQSGLGIDWKNYKPARDEPILQLIFTKTPPILKSLDKEHLDALRLSAGMMEIWGTNSGKKWLPDNYSIPLKMDVDSAARMLLFHAGSINDIRRYKESGIKFVQVLSGDKSCESCKKFAGKQYRIDQVIELPNPDCTHELGCRCCLIPIIDVPK